MKTRNSKESNSYGLKGSASRNGPNVLYAADNLPVDVIILNLYVECEDETTRNWVGLIIRVRDVKGAEEMAALLLESYKESHPVG